VVIALGLPHTPRIIEDSIRRRVEKPFSELAVEVVAHPISNLVGMGLGSLFHGGLYAETRKL